MQIGVFSVGDVTPDPVTGRAPTEHDRLRALATIARHAEQVGLDVVATGEHHDAAFVPSSPAVLLGHLAGVTSRITLGTAAALVTTNDPVRLAEEYATVQHLAEGRLDVMLGRGSTAAVYDWFGREPRDALPLALESYALLRRLWDEEVVDWEGEFRAPLRGFTATPRPLDGVPPFVWHASVRSPEVAELAATYGDGFFAHNLFAPMAHFARLIDDYRQRYADHGHGTPEQAVVGAGGQFFARARSQDAVAEFRPYFDRAPVYGKHLLGYELEEYAELTALTVGSPQQVIDRTLSFRQWYGDYARQLFLIDHAGLPLRVVLEQLDVLGEIAPVLRRELDALRPAGARDVPSHAERVAQRDAGPLAAPGRA